MFPPQNREAWIGEMLAGVVFLALIQWIPMAWNLWHG
jgi:hypothetical protein